VSRIIADKWTLNFDDIRTIVTKKLTGPGASQNAAHIQDFDTDERPTHFLSILSSKNPANLAVSRAGPHGDCGLRDQIVHREPVDNSVQLFYLGTFNRLRRRGLIDVRLFFAEPNQ
jgi:hypothetical protein